jgi:hypothetical protein
MRSIIGVRKLFKIGEANTLTASTRAASIASREKTHADGIAPRPRHACHEPATQEIFGHADNRNIAAFLLRGSDLRVAKHDNHIDGACNELVDESGEALVVPFQPKNNELNVAPHLPATQAHFLMKRSFEKISALGPPRITPTTGGRPAIH